MGAARYNPYPAYKASGIEWADELPSHWGAISLRWFARIFSGGTPSKTVQEYWQNGTVPWLNSGAINQIEITQPSKLISKRAFENSSAKWTPKGALFIALAGQGKTKGLVAYSKIETTCNQSMAAIVVGHGNYSKFYFWWLQSNYSNIRNMAGGDLRDGLNLELLSEIGCPIPSLPEQTKIAAFLDYETGKIDALIAKQERLIALLEEKRQAVISHAVTKGLHPNAPLRPSGIDWLGDVPEHWEVKWLKHLASIFGRIGFRGYTVDDIVDEGEGAIVLSPSNVKDERFSLEKRSYVSWEKYYESPEIMVSAGDILLVKTGSTFGKSAFVRSVDEPMTINPQMALIKIDKKWAEFVSFFLRTALIKATIEVSNTGSGMPTMTQENLGRFPVLIAPNDETNQIVEYLNEKSETFDALTAKAQSAITLLKERRTALISAAVTGKIDVRDWQAPARAADNSSTDLSIQDFDQVQEAIA